MIQEHDHFTLLDKPVVERYVFTPPMKANTPLHNEACFMHIVNGRSKLFTPEKDYELQSSDNFFMKCGSYMNKWFVNENDSPTEAVLVHIYPDLLKLIFEGNVPEQFRPKKSKNYQPVERIKLTEMIQSYANSLLYYFENPSLVSDELIKLKVKELLLLLINSHYSENLASIFGDMFSPQQVEFKNVIENHLFEDLSIEDLAIICGLSLSTFKRTFAKHFEESPKKYINRRRLEKAKDLLEQTDQRVSEIAYDCGFNDLGYFSKSFQAFYSMSPSEYRRAL